MDKLYVLKLRNTIHYCKSKRDLLRRISNSSGYEVYEYDLVSKSKASDFLKQSERDQQLRSVLGESSPFESSALELISHYERIAPDGNMVKRWSIATSSFELIKEKEVKLQLLKKFSTDKEEFKKILIDWKSYLFCISQDVDWLLSILKCHNFNDCVILTGKYPQPAELEENFRAAKQKLKIVRKMK